MKYLSTFIALWLSLSAAYAQDPNFYIYLCIGQSNMVGQGPIEAKDSAVSERFLNMTASDCDTHPLGQWRRAVPPLCRQWTKLCPADYFGRTMVDHLPDSVRVGTLMVAVDGCSIRLFHPDSCVQWVNGDLPDWQRGEVNCYGGDPLERLIELARKAQQSGVIKGILLHQGETDAYDERWLRMVKELYEHLLKKLDLQASECHLFAGETVGEEFGGVCAHALPTIRRLPEWIPTAHVISARGCAPLDDHVHFSSEGYRTLGRRYAAAALKTLGISLPDEETTPATAEQKAEQPSFNVDVRFKKNKAIITSAVPVKHVEIVSYSGEKVGFIDRVGAPTCKVSINLKDISDRVLIFIVEASNGMKTTVQVER